MKKNLLFVGGIFQVLIILLHIGMFFGIASAAELAAYAKQSLIIFNASVLTAAAFATYVSLFHRSELIGTGIGRVICWFIAIFYLQRGLVELFIRGFDITSLIMTGVMTGIYMAVVIPTRARAV